MPSDFYKAIGIEFATFIFSRLSIAAYRGIVTEDYQIKLAISIIGYCVRMFILLVVLYRLEDVSGLSKRYFSYPQSISPVTRLGYQLATL